MSFAVTIKVGGRYRRGWAWVGSGWRREWRVETRRVRGRLNQVHMSPKRACHRARPMVYLACIHMQIPIDMTTFTYCIFALGHILARQFPIVGFRPPVRLIDIIGRAADTRLHFYLHTFADQFDPTRSSPALFPSSTFPLFLFLLRQPVPEATISTWIPPLLFPVLIKHWVYIYMSRLDWTVRSTAD